MTTTNEIRKSKRKRITKTFHDDKPSLLKSTHLNLQKKPHIMYDAGSISLLTLKTMKSDSISMFNTQVDFRKCAMNIVDTLFPNKQFYGILNPLISRRISRRYITDFKCLSKKTKHYKW